MTIFSLFLHAGKANSRAWADAEETEWTKEGQSASDDLREVRLRASAGMYPTLAAAATFLAAATTTWSLKQQLYIAKHLDYITMIVGDGVVPGSFAQT